MSGLIPFDVGYVSGMTDAEMLDLASELEHSGWRRDQEIIRDAVDQYIRDVWRRGPSIPLSFPTMSSSYLTDPSPVAHTVYRTISVRVPDAVDEPEARVLAEMQIREQLYGEWPVEE